MSFSETLDAVWGPAHALVSDPITYTPTVGDAVEVDGIFDLAYIRLDVGQPGISTSGPSLFLLLADIAPLDPETDTGATVTVSSVTYSIHEVQPDGLGGIRLLLHRTS